MSEFGSAALSILQSVERRYLPCPDHRDKFSVEENGCPYCKIESLKSRLRKIEEVAQTYVNKSPQRDAQLLADHILSLAKEGKE